mgnify:FL=1
MKKLFIILGLVLFCSVFCFAEENKEEKYRYVMISDQAFMVADFSAKLPDEVLNDKCLSVNTKREQMEVEYGVKNIQSYFYSGQVIFLYVDYTKDINNPDMSYIDTWDDLISYIRRIK